MKAAPKMPERMDTAAAHAFAGIDFAPGGHSSQLGGICRPDPGRQHNAREKRTHFPNEGNRDDRRNQSHHPENPELIAGQQCHGQPDKNRKKDDHRNRSHTDTVALVKNVLSAKRCPTPRNPLSDLGNRVPQHPHQTSQFLQPGNGQLADLCNHPDASPLSLFRVLALVSPVSMDPAGDSTSLFGLASIPACARSR